MPKIINAFKDRDEWLSWRSKGLGSSDAPVLMGVSPWKTYQALWEEKCGINQKPQKTNSAQAQGIAMEPVARDMYEYKHSIKIPAMNFDHSEVSYFKASTDGFNLEQNFAAEIKVPGAKDVLMAQNGEIPEKYYPQVQWILMVTEANFLDYITLPPKGSDIIEVRVENDKEYQERLKENAHYFWHLVQTKTIPPVLTCGFL